MFSLYQPELLLAPLVLNAPHSGTVYTAEFLESSRLKPFNLRKCEDIYVEELFFIPECASLKATFPRSFLDVNREPYEFDPLLIEDNVFEFANATSAKVKAGLGTLPRLGLAGQEIYKNKLTLKEALERVQAYYFPYHAALHQLLELHHGLFSQVLLLDCHSMPSVATKYSGAQIVLGNRYGTSCSQEITCFVQGFLESHGYSVALNAPYAGGFITEHYGKPQLGYHALQIEVSRGLYVDEMTLLKRTKFSQLQHDLMALVKEIAMKLKKEPRFAT